MDHQSRTQRPHDAGPAVRPYALSDRFPMEEPGS
jgi:hypothetical protein